MRGLKRTGKTGKRITAWRECNALLTVDKKQRIMQIREVMTVLFLAVMGWKDWKKRNFTVADRYFMESLVLPLAFCRKTTGRLVSAILVVSLMILAVSVLTGGDWNGRWLDFSGTGTMLHTEMYVRMACIGDR